MDDRIFPRYVAANIGDHAEFSCNSGINAPPKWEFNRGFINRYATVKNINQIEIKSVSLNNTGSYVCYGAYGFPLVRFIAAAHLKVFGELIEECDYYLT